MHSGLQDRVAQSRTQKAALAHLGLWDVKYVGYVLPNASLKASFIVIAGFAYI